MSLEMGCYGLKKGISCSVPYIHARDERVVPLNSFMVNSIGFGGNAVSLIIAKK
jgi:3-oxoacyl-(acyl-carrier-protein) synthase